MKKRIITVWTFTHLLFFTNAIFIFAENPTSEIGIGFTGEDLTPTAPVDPDNPDDPGDGTGTGMGGPLSLDYVPNLNFGNQEITGRVETYESENLTPYLQVTDKRGTGEGWKVTATLSSFKSSDELHSFNGVITFGNGEVLTTTGNTSTPPTTYGTSITSEQTGQIVFATQDINEGLGTWITRWYPDNPIVANDAVTLTVNTANIITGVYTAQLEWIISNAP